MDQGDPYHDGGMGFDEGAPARPATNTLGLVGFVLSFCTGPIGLVVCLIALTKPPRGFAIAGVFISLISSVLLGLAIAAGVFGTGFVRAMSVGPDVTAWQRELEAVRSTSGSRTRGARPGGTSRSRAARTTSSPRLAGTSLSGRSTTC